MKVNKALCEIYLVLYLSHVETNRLLGMRVKFWATQLGFSGDLTVSLE